LRPFVLVNCAMSADGKIAGPERKQVRISSGEDMARVKALRLEYDAILVGVGTVIADDPHLTVKGASFEKNPLRIVLDTNGRTPDSARVLDGIARTAIVTCRECQKVWGPDVIEVRCGNGKIDMDGLMHVLYEELGVRKLLVEGGGETIASFFEKGLVDRYSVFVGGTVIGGRTSPTPVDGDGRVAPDGVPLRLESAEVLGNGALLTFTPVRPE